MPTLVRRIAELHVTVAQPFRLDSGKMRKPDELTRAIRVQAARVDGRGGIIVVLRDGDDRDVDCPVVLARQLAPDPGLVPVRVEIVIAWREHEAWCLAAVDSLTGRRAVRDDAVPPADPEHPRDAKGRLVRCMTESYRETLHQAGFSARLDLAAAARSSRSFRRLVHAIELLIT